MTIFATSTRGEHRVYSLDPPLEGQAGDLLTTDGRNVYLIRAGLVVATRTIEGSGAPVGATPLTENQTLSVITFFKETPVPGIVDTLISVVKTPTVLRYRFASGTELEFADEAAALAATQYLDTDLATVHDGLVLKSLRNDPDGTNLENMVGASMSFEFTADAPMMVSGGAQV